MDNIEVPEYFICPISLQIMKDPVTAITGITYDRGSIEHWLFKFECDNMICPVAKQALSKDSDLTPNHTLRRLIQAWCITNASMGIDRIPTPKPPLSKFHVLNLVKGLWVPKLQLKTLEKLEVLAMENERNMKYMVDAGVVKAMVTFIIASYKKKETTGLEEALSILHLFRSAEMKIVQDEITITGKADSGVLERLKVEFFQRIIQVLREGISQQGIKAALQNHRAHLGSIVPSLFMRRRESSASESAGGIAVITKRILNLSPAADDR
ncbi:unnamed protein product, partial [Ilex paraguariensis]